MHELDEFADEVGRDGEVTVAGMATRGGPVDDVRTVMAPAGIYDVQPDEMTIRCGAGTPVEMIDEALARFGQSVAVPPAGTIGGALAVPIVLAFESGLLNVGDYSPAVPLALSFVAGFAERLFVRRLERMLG